MPGIENAETRLRHLYEISKLLITFESAEKTFDAALGIAAQTLPLRSAILIEQRPGDSRMILWSSPGQNPSMMGNAKDHAEEAFRYLVGAQTREPLHLREQAGATELPDTADLAAEIGQKRFIVIPLVVRRRAFGAVQLEGAGSLKERDLAFANAIGNQLALALEQRRAWTRDIALREEAEIKEASAEELRVAAERLMERYQALVDNLDSAFVWEADATTLEMIYVSAHVEKLLGYSRRGWIEETRSWKEHVHPDDWAALHGAFTQARAGKKNQRCEHRCIARDGREVWFHTGVHLAESDVDAPRLQGVSVDITDRIRAEEAQQFLLRASKALGATLDYPSLLNQLARFGLPKLGDLCVFNVVRADGEIIRSAWAHVDPKKEQRLTEVLSDPLLLAVKSHSFSSIIAPGSSELVPIVDEAWMRGAQIHPELRDLIRELGLQSLMTVPVTLGNRTLGALSFAVGDSERRYTEADLAIAEELARRAAFALENGRLYEEAQRAIRLREQILGIVSHDLMNPLASILMTTNLWEKSLQPDDLNPGAANAASRIERAARRMQRLIEDLVDFASIQAGRLSIKMHAHDPVSIVAETTASFEAPAKDKNLRITSEVNGHLPDIDCDRDRILQVLANLVGNAVKVSSNGIITLRVELQGNDVRFGVSDSGPGISGQDLEHIFDLYWRSGQARYKGTGLGLAIARGIVTAHGGQIWAESKLGEGASFFFTVPVSRKPAPLRRETTIH